MIGFLLIFGASLAAYAGLGVWVVGAATIGLASLSYAERHGLYQRASEVGATAMADRTMLGSVLNAFVATGAAYAFGYLMRLI